MKTKFKIRQVAIAANYIFAFLYCVIISLGLIAFVYMMSDLPMRLMDIKTVRNPVYWAFVILASSGLGTLENFKQKLFKD